MEKVSIKRKNKMRIISFIILFAITFWFKGNILYWIDLSTIDSETKEAYSYNWIQFQLDHKDPPTINEKPISSIKVTEKEVFVIAGEKCWILNYEGNSQTDWYVEDPFSL